MPPFKYNPEPNPNPKSRCILAQDALGRERQRITPIATQDATAVLGEVGVLLDGPAVADLVLHAVDEHEDRQQRLERGAERAVVPEEGDVQREAVGEEGLREESFAHGTNESTTTHLGGDHHELDAIQRAPVLEEQQVGLVGLARKHADAHALDEQRRACEDDRGALGGAEVRLAHAVDPEQRRPEVVRLGDVLGRVDVLDARGVRDAVEVEGERDLGQRHQGGGRGARGPNRREGCKPRGAWDGQHEEEEEEGQH